MNDIYQNIQLFKLIILSSSNAQHVKLIKLSWITKMFYILYCIIEYNQQKMNRNILH